MPVKVKKNCSGCGHPAVIHERWGGQKHYHGKHKITCSEKHHYCMVPDCQCYAIAGDQRKPREDV